MPSRSQVELPFGFNILLIAFGAIVLGAHTATAYVAPLEPSQIVSPSTQTITKRVHGRIITLPSGTRVVRVQQILVHTDSKTIVVPAQTLPIVGFGATIRARANVPVTITIRVPPGGGSTVTGTVSVSTVTETLPPSTVTVTLPPVTVTVPTTVTLPVSTPTISDQGGQSGP